jgi:ribosomal protein S7
MKKRYRDLTEKYKTCRLQPEPLFQSRLLQTFFNKFTKKGKKALARRHLQRALSNLRLAVSRPQTYNALLRIFRNLYTPLMLVTKRKGKILELVPVPVRRNKRETLSLHVLYSAVDQRRERYFFERIEQELLDVTQNQSSAPTLQNLSKSNAKTAAEAANFEMR